MFTTRTSKFGKWRALAPLLLMTLTLLLSGLACSAAASLIQTEAATSPFASNQAMEKGYCPAVLSSIARAGTITVSYNVPEEESRLVTYPVQGNELGDPLYEAAPADLYDEQADVPAQQAIWTYFASIIPEQDREFLTEFSVLTDGRNNLLAAVAQSQTDPADWRLEVDIIDAQDYEGLTFTLIHEFGHLLTLNEEQVSPNMAVFNNPHDSALRSHEAAMCPSFFANEGCSKRNSYINQFFQRFWSDKYEEWHEVESIQDEYLYYMRLNEFYEKYQDQFVTEYAATNPGEDVAESWTYFVLKPKPQGSTIAEKKVLFFYEYPELVELRQEITNNLCNAFPE
jgi:hypothetical protein